MIAAGVTSRGRRRTILRERRRIDAQGNERRVPLGISSTRNSVALEGTAYGVVYDDNVGAKLLRVAVGGGVLGAPIPFGTVSTGGSAPRAQTPDIARASGGGFLVSWSESVYGSPSPLKYARVPSGALAIAGAPLSAQTNTAFHSLATGPCGLGVTYGTFTAASFDYLDVRP